MLTASIILQCICIVIVEAFNHNSITTKNMLSSQVLITLTHSPSSLTSVSLISLPLSLSYSLPALTPQPHSVPTLSYSLTLLNSVYPYSLICHSLPHPPASLTPFLSHSLTPSSLTHSLPCLIHSLFHSFSLAHFSASHFLTHSLLCIILSHSLPSHTDFASLPPSLTP